jgi:sugar lactone lactonase YvrE
MKHQTQGRGKLWKAALVFFAGVLIAPPARCQGQGYIITTVAGNGTEVDTGDGGPAITAGIFGAVDVVSDAAGNLYIADVRGNRVRRVAAATGIITTVAGGGSPSDGLGDGGPATGADLSPSGVAVDAAGNLYIADSGSNRIRVVNAAGIITTAAGNGEAGFSGDGGPATSAEIHSPMGVTVDAAGNLFIADMNNGRIRRVDAATGIITTVAGTAWACDGMCYPADGDGGLAINAQLLSPNSVAVDGAGNLFIAESNDCILCAFFYNRVRKVDAATGIITTVVPEGYTYEPQGLAADGAGNLFFGDTGGCLIGEVTTAGAIVRVAGNSALCGLGGDEDTGDGGLAINATLGPSVPGAVDRAGNVYIADNQRVRVLTPVGTRAILSATVSHAEDFVQGETGATYTVTISDNALAGPASGPVTVTELVPDGLQLAQMSGIGWSCSSNACSRGDGLAAGSSYAPITVTVNVTASQPTQVLNQVSVIGGGSFPTGASDLTNILTTPSSPVLAAPANGAANVPLASVLTWSAVSGAASYDVYFGTLPTPSFTVNTTALVYTPPALLPRSTTYYWQVVAKNAAGSAASPVWSFTTRAGEAPKIDKIGTFNAGQWSLDVAGNGGVSGVLNASFGWPGVTYVTGDWNGDGHTKIGIFYNGYWYLDYDGNGVWDGGVNDKAYTFGWADPSVVPVVGDWNGDGRTKIGVYYQGFWFLDYDGNGVWDGGVNDKQYNFGWGDPNVLPKVADWSGSGTSKIGIYYQGLWFVDYDGNGVWDGGAQNGGVDEWGQFGWNAPGVTPVIGDWNGDGRAKAGIYYQGAWYLDYDGNFAWDGGVNDKQYNFVSSDPNATPLVGDWTGTGTTKIGLFSPGYDWALDANGNGIWAGPPTDFYYQFGSAGDVPVVGSW